VRAAFDVLVALHVTCAVVGFASVAVSGAYGVIAPGSPEEGRRYFSSPGRAELLILAVPVFGVAALAVRPSGHDFAAAWVLAALGIWAAASALLLGVVRPAERRLRASVGDRAAARALARAGAACDVLFAAAVFLMITQPR